MTEIRPATELDHFALFRLAVAMHRETDFKRYTLNPQKMIDAMLHWLREPDAIAFVAEAKAEGEPNELVGFFLGKITKPWFSDELCAVEDCFYVTPEHRGSRAGYLLVKAFMGWAELRDVAHVRAGVSSGMGNAGGRLYEHFGMKHMGGNYIAHTKEQSHVLQ